MHVVAAGHAEYDGLCSTRPPARCTRGRPRWRHHVLIANGTFAVHRPLYADSGSAAVPCATSNHAASEGACHNEGYHVPPSDCPSQSSSRCQYRCHYYHSTNTQYTRNENVTERERSFGGVTQKGKAQRQKDGACSPKPPLGYFLQGARMLQLFKSRELSALVETIPRKGSHAAKKTSVTRKLIGQNLLHVNVLQTSRIRVA